MKNTVMVNGKRMTCRIYDDGGKSIDRYTAVYRGFRIGGRSGHPLVYPYVGFSAAPFHPQGFGQHGESTGQPIDRPSGKHLGKRIAFESLNGDCQRLIMQDLTA